MGPFIDAKQSVMPGTDAKASLEDFPEVAKLLDEFSGSLMGAVTTSARTLKEHLNKPAKPLFLTGDAKAQPKAVNDQAVRAMHFSLDFDNCLESFAYRKIRWQTVENLAKQYEVLLREGKKESAELLARIRDVEEKIFCKFNAPLIDFITAQALKDNVDCVQLSIGSNRQDGFLDKLNSQRREDPDAKPGEEVTGRTISCTTALLILEKKLTQKFEGKVKVVINRRTRTDDINKEKAGTFFDTQSIEAEGWYVNANFSGSKGVAIAKMDSSKLTILLPLLHMFADTFSGKSESPQIFYFVDDDCRDEIFPALRLLLTQNPQLIPEGIELRFLPWVQHNLDNSRKVVSIVGTGKPDPTRYRLLLEAACGNAEPKKTLASANPLDFLSEFNKKLEWFSQFALTKDSDAKEPSPQVERGIDFFRLLSQVEKDYSRLQELVKEELGYAGMGDEDFLSIGGGLGGGFGVRSINEKAAYRSTAKLRELRQTIKTLGLKTQADLTVNIVKDIQRLSLVKALLEMIDTTQAFLQNSFLIPDHFSDKERAKGIIKGACDLFRLAYFNLFLRKLFPEIAVQFDAFITEGWKILRGHEFYQKVPSLNDLIEAELSEFDKFVKCEETSALSAALRAVPGINPLIGAAAAPLLDANRSAAAPEASAKAAAVVAIGLRK